MVNPKKYTCAVTNNLHKLRVVHEGLDHGIVHHLGHHLWIVPELFLHLGDVGHPASACAAGATKHGLHLHQRRHGIGLTLPAGTRRSEGVQGRSSSGRGIGGLQPGHRGRTHRRCRRGASAPTPAITTGRSAPLDQIDHPAVLHAVLSQRLGRVAHDPALVHEPLPRCRDGLHRDSRIGVTTATGRGSGVAGALDHGRGEEALEHGHGGVRGDAGGRGVGLELAAGREPNGQVQPLGLAAAHDYDLEYMSRSKDVGSVSVQSNEVS